MDAARTLIYVWMYWILNLRNTIANDLWDTGYDSDSFAIDGDIRLVGKRRDDAILPVDHDAYYGRVEIYKNLKWISVCSADWGIDEAKVVCRQLGFPGAVSAHGNAYYGQGYGSDLLGGVSCHGDEEKLNDCEHDFWTSSCGHSDDVGVVCVEPDLYYPRIVGISWDILEVWDGDRWRTVCSIDFGKEEASAACKHLGFESFTSWYKNFPFDVAPPLSLGFSCGPEDGALSDCNTTVISSSDCGNVQLYCGPDDGDIRLLGSRPDMVPLPTDHDAYYGRVEIYNDFEWFSVCGAGWGKNEAEVACRQLGFPGAVSAHGNAYYGEGYGSFHLGEVRCNGNESTLGECEHDPWTQHSCGHSEDVGVLCVKPGLYYPRLVTTFDTLEVWDGARWSRMCSKDFGTKEATTACLHLGFAGLSSWYAKFPEGDDTPRLNVRFSCGSGDKELSDCETGEIDTSDCGNVELNCISFAEYWYDLYHAEGKEGEIRLVGNRDNDDPLLADSDAYYGRVEIYHDREWGSICSADWGKEEAEVVCRELGFPGAVSAHGKAYYGEGHGPVLLGNVRCHGNEESLDECQHDPWSQHSCGHSDDVGVLCVKPDLYYPRLVGAFDALDVWDGARWRRVCTTGFDVPEAKAACNNLGFVGFYHGYLIIGSTVDDDTPPLDRRFSCGQQAEKLSDCSTAAIDTSDCGSVQLSCEEYSFWTSPFAIIIYVVGVNVVAISVGVYVRRRRRRIRTVTTVTVENIEGATAAQPDDSDTLGNVPYERFE